MLRTCQLAPHLRGIGALLAAGFIASMAPARASAQTEDVVFRSAVGVTVSGNDLTKTAATGWNNAGAVSVQTLESNGFVEFSGASGAAFVVGLSKGDTDQRPQDIEFGIYLTGTVAVVYQGGSQPYNSGSYTTSDKFRIEAAGNVVRYRKNGVVLWTSAGAAPFPLLVDTAIYSTGPAVVDARIGQTTFSAEAGVTASEGTLTKTSAVGWNAGAVSARRIPWRDGSVEFTAIETNKLRAAGLSNGDTDKTAADIDFAILLRADGIVEIQESGTSRGTFGSYATNDRFRVTVQNGVVSYLRNGSLMYPSAVAPVFPLWADTALYDVGATLSDVVVSEISWTSTASVIVSAGTLTKTGSAGWNGGASSTASIASGDGFVEFTANETNTTRACGLADSVSSYDPALIDFAIQLQSNGNAQVYESGTPRGTASTYASGDRFRVEVQYGVVKYRKNGVVFYTSNLAPPYPLSVDAVLDTVGGTLREVRLGRLVFRNDVGVAVWGYSLLNTAATGWGNSGASSTLELASGDGWVEYTATDLSSSRTLGLSNGDSSRHYNEIDFGLSVWNGSLWAHQNGSMIGSCCGSFVAGDRLRIAVEGGVVKYRKNGALLATSSQTVQYPLLVDAALSTSGTSMTDIVVSPNFTNSTLIVPPLSLSPGAGTYNIAQAVTVTCDVVGTEAHYTTNGADPTQTDPAVACGGTVSVGQSLTLKVKGWKTGYIPSVVTTAAYTMVVGTPSFSLPPGAYTGIQSVALSTVTTGATISYTTNGADPNPGTPGTSVNVDHTLVLKAKATKAGWTDSNLTWGTYVITVGTVATPILSPAPGSYTGSQNVTISCATSGATIRYTRDGTDPSPSSPVYTGPLTVAWSQSIKARAYKLDWVPSALAGGSYTIGTGIAGPPMMSPPGGRYGGGLGVLVTGTTVGSTIRYTTDGTDPTDTSPIIGSGSTITVGRSAQFKMRATAPGLQPSVVVTADYEIVGSVAAGAKHVVALRADGTVASWGYNTSGQLGDGTTTARSSPVNVIGGLNNVIAIATGDNFTVALKQDGTVWSWGANQGSILGAGIPDAYRTSPVQVVTASGPLTGVVAISAGVFHTLALKSDGTVWAWGVGGDGQLGQGNESNQSRAIQVPGLTGVTAIDAGGWYSLALQTNGGPVGYVWGWGKNDNGQLLDGTTTNRSSPTLAQTTAIFIAANMVQAFVGKPDGTLWGLGLNDYGQLGNGTTTTPQLTLAPALNGVTGGVKKISGSSAHTIALTAAGEVWGAGFNDKGALGDGTRVDKPTPFRAILLHDVVDSAGSAYPHSIFQPAIESGVAVAGDGRVWTWGANQFLMLGDGTGLGDHRYRPQPIPNFSLADQSWPLGDPDGDGLVTKDELTLGTNPYSADTNGDGIADGTAVRSGLNPTSLDMDGDGVTNTVERTTKGTDPLRADTDGDGVGDGTDCFPLDPTRTTCPTPQPGDVTPPVITLTEPVSAVLIGSQP